MEGRPGSEHEHYAVFDPKLPPGRSSPDQAKGPFREALVFVIGGGNYLEREVSGGFGQGQRGAFKGGVAGALSTPSGRRKRRRCD